MGENKREYMTVDILVKVEVTLDVEYLEDDSFPIKIHEIVEAYTNVHKLTPHMVMKALNRENTDEEILQLIKENKERK